MNHHGFEDQVRRIGHEIFELADAARPRLWNKAWWLEQGTYWVDRDPVLRGRAFQFVDCLPSLQCDRALVRHLAEYLDPRFVNLPPFVAALLSRQGQCAAQSNGVGFQRASIPATKQGEGRKRLLEMIVAKAARFGAARMAERFIAGYDPPSVVRTLNRFRSQGLAFTLDVLGESTTSYAQSDRYAQLYHQLIDRLSETTRQWPAVALLDSDDCGPMPRLNLSIKLTGLDPHCDGIDPDRAIREIGTRLRPLLRHARRVGAFVNIDMESTKHRAITLEVFQRVLLEDEFRDWPDVGLAIQAYLIDSERDLLALLEWGKQRGQRFALRLVKGAYWDSESASAVRNGKVPPVWTQKWQTDACYERMARTMLENRHLVRPAFASHNVRSLAFVLATAERLGATPHSYELQALCGMGDPLKMALVQMGRRVRVYCPYGDLMQGMAYLIRRLLENTSNEGFLKQSFSDRGTHERLLADPAVARPASAPLPAPRSQDTYPEESMSAFTNASNTDFTSAENRRKMNGALAYVRGELGRSYPLILNGECVQTGEWFDSHNPSQPSEVVGRVAAATTADADCAVAAARRAFAHWRTTTAMERGELLRRTAQRLEDRRFELAALMILEVGKPWREADADVSEAIDHCRYYADQIERIEARPRLRDVPGENNMLAYSPKGVCAVLSPWPFPLAILAGMTTAALAAGNTVVLKPARQASVTAARFVEILHLAGVPTGVAHYLPGAGSSVGTHLVQHEDVNLVAFTGSAEVGTGVLRAGSTLRAGQAFIRKLIVEMGGKNAIIIDEDADFDGAVQAVIESAFAFAGQKCSSCSRLIVLNGIYEPFCRRLSEAIESLVIGPAEEPSALVGPLIDEAARDRVRAYIDLGRTEGRFLAQAKLPAGCRDGWFVAPTLLTEVKPDARVAQEEVLGPVLAVLRARDFEEALALANGTRFALTGGVFSRSPAHIDRARREFAVGNLYINRKITGSQVDAQPFGGFRLSGTGVKAGSPDYLLHFMDARCITENTQRSGFVPAAKNVEIH